jgi:hypothetical protein
LPARATRQTHKHTLGWLAVPSCPCTIPALIPLSSYLPCVTGIRPLAHFHALENAFPCVRIGRCHDGCQNKQSVSYQAFFGPIPRGEASSLVENVFLRTFGEITFLVPTPAPAAAVHRTVHACQGPDGDPCQELSDFVCSGAARRATAFRSKECCWRSVFCSTSTSARAATLTLLLPQREVELQDVMMRPRRLQGCGADRSFAGNKKNSPCARLRLHAIRRRTEMHVMHGSVPTHTCGMQTHDNAFNAWKCAH